MHPHRRVRSLVAVLIGIFATAGCPRGQQTVLGQVPPPPSSGSPEARARFVESQSRFEQSGADVTEELEILVRDFPNDPVVPHALLYAAVSAVRAGKYEVALKDLTTLEQQKAVDPAIAGRGKMYKGISLNYLGRHADALTELRAAEDVVNRHDQQEQGEWLAAMAVANHKTGHPEVAIRFYDAWYRVATSTEKAFAAQQVKALVDGVADAAIEPTYRSLEGKDGPGAAYVGERLASIYTARGDGDRAAQVRGEIAAARAALGESEDALTSSEGETGRLGALLPLSGRRNRIGDRSMRGITMAAGVFGPNQDQRFEVAVRDSVKAGTSEGAVEELAGEKVIAVVGPIDSDAALAAGRHAGSKGVPLISLSPRGSVKADSSRFVFHIVHSAEARARALARYAVSHRIKDFAILAPASAYGRVVGSAFADEVRRLGGRIAVTASYPDNATSFTKSIAELKKPWRAIFIPDQARRLGLVAPALAAANFAARPVEEAPARSGPRKILLLSTAELVDDAFMRSSGRYALGGVLAPGFFPDRKDDTIGRFVASYVESFGTLPTSLEAYAYDAVAVVAQAIRAGASNRDQVAARLAASQVTGLTGTIGFASTHDRSDDGVLFRVEQLPSGEVELRAMR